MPSVRHGYRHATFFFLRVLVGCLWQGEAGEMEVEMLLYRYMPYKFWYETVKTGWFAAQKPSHFRDIHEGNAMIGSAIKLAASAFDNQISVLCFNKVEGTTDDAEQRLWADCADGHSGVRIVMDCSSDILNLRMFWFGDSVAYDNKMVEITKDEMMSAASFRRPNDILSRNSWFPFSKCLFTKNKSYDWENEYRIIFLNNQIDNLIEQRVCDSAEKEKRWFLRFPTECIVGVDFGARILERSDGIERVARDVKNIRNERPNLKMGIMTTSLSEKRIFRLNLDEYLKSNSFS